MKKRFLNYILKKYKNNQPLTMLTAYDAITAQCLEDADIDIILVGDSVGNLVAGFETTLSVTLDHMLYHAQAVKRGAPNSIIIVDMPFMTYRINDSETKRHAMYLMQESNATALKIEVQTQQDIDTIKTLVDSGIPVMSHIGLVPQSVEALGGFKYQGKDTDSAKKLQSLAQLCQNAGSFCIVLECIDHQLAHIITQSLSIPTIGIGSGSSCSGQVLVINDLLGLSSRTPPSFSKQYDSFYDRMKNAVTSYIDDVQQNRFPNKI